VRIISKTGPLNNPADRDHCLQYMVAIPLIFGTLTAAHYENDFSADPRIDALRAKMHVNENPAYSRDYLDPEKRSIANALQVFFSDGTSTPRVEVQYPIGHRRRRADATPLLKKKFLSSVENRLPHERAQQLLELFEQPEKLDELSADALMGMLTPE